MLSGRTQNKFPIFPVILLVLISVYSVWPVLINFTNSIVSYGDTLLLTWILNQNIEKIPGELINIFEGNIFYPERQVMAYSDLFLPSSFISFFPVKLFQIPVSAYNFSLIFSQIFCTIITFFIFRDITKNNVSSFIAAAAMSLSQIRFFFAGYLQMWALEWFLLSLWFFLRYIKTYKKLFLILSFTLIGIQFWESPLPVFFFAFSVFPLIFLNLKNLRSNFKDFFLPLILFSAVAAIPAIVYFNIAKNLGVVRSIREAAHFSMNLNDIWEILASPGLYSIAFISIIVFLVRKVKKSKELIWFSVISITGFVMALGPVLKMYGKTFKLSGDLFIPLPYGIFYYSVPGFTGLRTPLRWIWLFAFGLAGISAIVLANERLLKKKTIVILLLLIALLGGTGLTKVYPVPEFDEFPKVYEFIKNLPGDSIIEMPLYTWGAGEAHQKEFWRMYYSLYHKKYSVNGASGLNSLPWEKLAGILWTEFPEGDSENLLIKRNVYYVVVHKDEYDKERLDKIDAWGRNKLIYEDDNNLVFTLK